ncbi:Eco57I restriction-modification methylase domain-containing protein, partial [Vibrio rarus]
MRTALDKTLRKKLEDTVIKARDIVEAAVNEVLERLGVAESQAPSYLTEEQRKLRNKLRAHARQLGDRLLDGKQGTERLANEMAYEHWHRMLFARYLEQNDLLMYDEHTPVTLDECVELAEQEPDCKDGWELAGRLAQKMLPQIFRVDSPVFDIKLSMNRVEELESLIAQLDPQTYQAQDSLGWCYQFWQTKKKDQVNKSGVKIGAQELSPVTQLFTEPYMVSFLLDNALGAWWANKRLSQDDLIRANNEQELRELAAIPGVPLEYLRFSKEEEATQWKPAAGGFEKWPEHLSELKTLDPCCGSGHFLVAVFLMLVPMRMQLEGLSEKQAVDAVLRDNIHGLELDQRCVELAAFALALEAWRYPNAGGYRVLPELQLACSGMSITEAQKEWKDLAKGDEALTDAIAWMQDTFKDASTLGSLINPLKVLSDDKSKPWEVLQHRLANQMDVDFESKSVAQGLLKAASLLVDKYQWVITNVPYLSKSKHTDVLKQEIEDNYPLSKSDLATVFLEKSFELSKTGGVSSIVLPQNWLFLTSYKHLRKYLLENYTWISVCRLGSGAFETISGEVVQVVLLQMRKSHPLETNVIASIDVSDFKYVQQKSNSLRYGDPEFGIQVNQLKNPDSRINFKQEYGELLEESAGCYQGISPADFPRFGRNFSEVNANGWVHWQSTVKQTLHFGGRELVLNLSDVKYKAEVEGTAYIRGTEAWGKKCITISAMGDLPVTLGTGEASDTNVAQMVINDSKALPALWCYAESGELSRQIREIDQALKVTNSTMLKVGFELSKWEHIAKYLYPNGLPKPYSNDLTQWIFHGHPCASVIWDKDSKTTAVAYLRQDDTALQVAVARLLGYQWPAELNPEMELAPEMREVMKKNADFAGLIDDDGIVCIPAVRGEKTAAKRLEAILHKAYGDEWTTSVEQNLLKAVKAKDLESWLRDKFFDQHSKLFQHRPFIWQVWDGLKDGFSALVNYH